MDILEKILTGNLGYGTVVLVVMLFIGVYQQFIVPKLNKADELEEKKNKEIAELETLIKDKDSLLTSSIGTISDQQQAIEKLSIASASSSHTIENLSKLDSINKAVDRLEAEFDRLLEKYGKDSLEIRQELKQYELVLEKLKTDLTSKIEPAIKEGQIDIIKVITGLEKNIRELSSQRFNEQSQLSTSLSNISTDLSDLKNITSAQLNTRLQQNKMGDGTMQDLK